MKEQLNVKKEKEKKEKRNKAGAAGIRTRDLLKRNTRTQ
jgi:hypothetical protein